MPDFCTPNLDRADPAPAFAAVTDAGPLLLSTDLLSQQQPPCQPHPLQSCQCHLCKLLKGSQVSLWKGCSPVNASVHTLPSASCQQRFCLALRMSAVILKAVSAAGGLCAAAGCGTLHAPGSGLRHSRRQCLCPVQGEQARVHSMQHHILIMAWMRLYSWLRQRAELGQGRGSPRLMQSLHC